MGRTTSRPRSLSSDLKRPSGAVGVFARSTGAVLCLLVCSRLDMGENPLRSEAAAVQSDFLIRIKLVLGSPNHLGDSASAVIPRRS